MWRVASVLRQKWGLRGSPQTLVPCRGFKNFVLNDALEQMEHACEQFYPCPRKPPQKVTVVGAGSDVGRIACLFLKQQNVIKTLAMYDDIPARKVIGAAHDIAHIDTSPAVEAYQGRPYLQAALDNTDVVLICGGYYPGPPCCNILDRELFFHNMQFVRTIAIACAHFCPQAVIAVQTPPVDCNFNLCKYTLKKYHAYSPARLLGVNAINAMRANQLYCALADFDPHKHYAPVVCGTGRCTRVPVFSNMESYVCMAGDQIDCITRLVREADELICRVKSNNEQGHLSIGFSTARFVTQIMKGLFEKPAFIDSAMVDQASPEMSYGLETCATPVVMGRKGIKKIIIPTLNEKEQALLDESRCDLKDMMNLGRCYAVGDEYEMDECKYYEVEPPPPCPVCEEAKICPCLTRRKEKAGWFG